MTRTFLPRWRQWLVLYAMAYAAVTSSQAAAYEAELGVLAKNLVTKLEASGQRSGTVLDFTDLQGSATELGRFLAQELSDKLVGVANTVSFVDRANLQYLLREHKLSMDGLVNPETSRKLGNLIGVDTIVLGSTTPVGDKIRLSVRAIAVDTGRIVASQSETLPTSKDLAQLFHRGVASAPVSGGTSGTSPVVPPSDTRTRFRPDTIKVTGREIIVDPTSCCAGVEAIVSFSVENLSGIALGMGILAESVTAGSCSGGSRGDTSGLQAFVDHALPRPEQLPWVTAGARIAVKTRLFGCTALARSTSADITVMFLVALEDKIMRLPVTASGVPVRVLR